MKMNRARLKEIIRSVMSEEKDYEKYFRKELEKAGFSSPAEMSDDEKREFFNKIDSGWKGKNEELTGDQHKLDVDGDGDISGDDLAALRAGKKPVKEAALPNDGSTIKVSNIPVKIEYINNKKYIGYSWKDKNTNKEHYEETKTSEHPNLESLIKTITGEIRYQRIHKTEGNTFGAAVVKAKKAGKDEFSVDGKKFPVKEEKSKYYVEIDTPREVDSNRVKGEIKSFMKRGARAADIGLRMNFLTTDPKDMMNKFQKVKNHVYFANDPRRFESVDEGVMKPGKKIRLVIGWAGENQPVKNDKYVVYQLVNNRYFSMRGISGGMTYLWKAIESTDPHIKVGSTEEIHPKQLKSGLKHGFYVMESVKRMSEGKFDADLDKVEAAVKAASSFMGVGAELKKAGIKYDFSTSMMPMYRIKVPGNTIAIVNKKYAAGAEREVKDLAIGLLENVLKVEGLSVDIAKHMDKIYKGFVKVEGDGTMIYDSPATAKKAADILNKNKIAASTDGKYLHIESKKSKR